MPRFRSPLLPIALCVAAAAPLLASSGCFQLEPVPQQTPARLTSNVQDWRDEVIYQVLVDRFANGTPSNDWRVNRTSLARYQGGDWQGLIDHLDYFTALGVTTLWISPIVRNVETDAGIDGYHGYWASDLAELNPHFGDLTTLRRLVQEAHRRNLRVVVDIVTNHMGQMFYYDINQNGRPDDNLYGGGAGNQFQNPGVMDSPLQRVSEFDPDFNARGVVQSFTSLGPAGPAPVTFINYPDIFRVPPRYDRPCATNGPIDDDLACNSWQRILAAPEGYHRRGRIVRYDNFNHQPGEEVLTGDFPGGLKDVATERPDVRAAMIQAYWRWIALTDIDGFRIDTLKHVEHDFWREFSAGIRQRAAAHGKNNFFLFGEAFDGDDELIGSYTQENEMDSVVYFSQLFRVYRTVFQCEGPTQPLESFYTTERPAHFRTQPQPNGAGAPPSQLLVNFFDNHDVARFQYGVQRGLLEDPSGDQCPNGRVNSPEDQTLMRTKMRAALAFMFTQDGIPAIYYGTEQDFRGGNDPANREVMWELARDYRDPMTGDPNEHARDFPTGTHTDPSSTFGYIARLARIRRAYEPLRRGSLEFRWTSMRTGDTDQDAGILAFERATADARVLVVINTHTSRANPPRPSETSATNMGGGPMMTGFPAGTELVDVLGTEGQSYTVGAGGSLTVQLESHRAVILVPRAQVQELR